MGKKKVRTHPTSFKAKVALSAKRNFTNRSGGLRWSSIERLREQVTTCYLLDVNNTIFHLKPGEFGLIVIGIFYIQQHVAKVLFASQFRFWNITIDQLKCGLKRLNAADHSRL